MADEEKRSTQSGISHDDRVQPYFQNVKSTRESDSKSRTPKLTLQYPVHKSTPVSKEASPEADKRSRSEENFDKEEKNSASSRNHETTAKLVSMVNQL
jgi:hypothetical protein